LSVNGELFDNLFSPSARPKQTVKSDRKCSEKRPASRGGVWPTVKTVIQRLWFEGFDGRAAGCDKLRTIVRPVFSYGSLETAARGSSKKVAQLNRAGFMPRTFTIPAATRPGVGLDFFRANPGAGISSLI
jgi:hypothetical protein